ncbi:hypothetical protein RTE01_02930 [Raoultella terrigena]|uniref:PhoD-like phosphatase n=1 Tax=Raoultella terrigena TaxID=577 RepID=A0A485BFU8_RAOTE|nr:alkaline phosphatase D family protein [Raoultella terrigena]GEC65658.1 hypothetical protein RTE01_02930 [Raoultella terrigena]VFS72637.1 PhoD-like phosphatase [Raoultella terrigena]
MPYLMVRPLLGNVGVIQLWVGVFGYKTAPILNFTLNEKAVSPEISSQPLAPIRDDDCLNKQPLSYQGIYEFSVQGNDIEHRFNVSIPQDGTSRFLAVKSLPAKVPFLGNSFKIMLMSCYCAGTDAVGVGDFVQQIPVRPDMTLFAGDQVYLDQPPFFHMPDSAEKLRKNIAAKYRRNWLSDFTGQRGLQKALTKAPTLCLPDDHEFWNNYPWEQVWKEGTGPEPGANGINHWEVAARELLQDFQLGGTPASQQPWTLLEIEPLSMLFLDTRSYRQKNFTSPAGLMPDSAWKAVEKWRDNLLDHQINGKPLIGVLATGQALFCEPTGLLLNKMGDAELANYTTQFAKLMESIDKLGESGVQVIFLTGDVHWNRVAQANHTRTKRTTLTEVICSPTSLCLTPGVDQANIAKHTVGGLFGKNSDWKRHSDPDTPPKYVGEKNQFSPFEKFYGMRGNHVAIIEFTRSGSGVNMTVNYYPITYPASPAVSTRTYPIINVNT